MFVCAGLLNCFFLTNQTEIIRDNSNLTHVLEQPEPKCRNKEISKKLKDLEKLTKRVNIEKLKVRKYEFRNTWA